MCIAMQIGGFTGSMQTVPNPLTGSMQTVPNPPDVPNPPESQQGNSVTVTEFGHPIRTTRRARYVSNYSGIAWLVAQRRITFPTLTHLVMGLEWPSANLIG